jgi:hypothetical protein
MRSSLHQRRDPEGLGGKRPVLFVYTKKKELLGNDANAGRQWRKTKTPQHVAVHDFPHPAVPRAFNTASTIWRAIPAS